MELRQSPPTTVMAVAKRRTKWDATGTKNVQRLCHNTVPLLRAPRVARQGEPWLSLRLGPLSLPHRPNNTGKGLGPGDIANLPTGRRLVPVTRSSRCQWQLSVFRATVPAGPRPCGPASANRYLFHGVQVHRDADSARSHTGHQVAAFALVATAQPLPVPVAVPAAFENSWRCQCVLPCTVTCPGLTIVLPSGLPSLALSRSASS